MNDHGSRSPITLIPLMLIIALLGAGAWIFVIADAVGPSLEIFGLSTGHMLRWVEFAALTLVTAGIALFSVLCTLAIAARTESTPPQAPIGMSELQATRFSRCQKARKIGCWDFEPSSGEIWWSDETYRLLGVEPRELSPSFEFVINQTHPDDRQKMRDVTDAALAGDATYDLEYRFLRKDGAEITLHAHGDTIYDATGNVIRIDGTVQDVTDRVRADRKLKKSEFLLSEAERIAHLGTWDYDVSNDILWWSDETFRLFGFEPGSFTPTSEKLVQTIHPDDREYAEEQIRRCVAENEVLSYDHRIVRPDGTVRHVHERGEIFFDDLGNLVRTTGTVLDITDRMRHEHELKLAHGEMEQRVIERTGQVRRQASIIDQLNDAVFSTNLDGVVDSWNTGAQRMFGYTPEDMIGRRTSILYAADNREELDAATSESLKRNGTLEIDAPMVRQNGSTFIGQLVLTVTPSGGQGPNTVVGYVHDITQRKAADEALAESERNLRNLTNLSPVGIFRSDPLGNITYVNDTWLTLLNMDSETAAGDGWANAVHPNDRASSVEKWQRFVSHGEPYENEARILRSDGTIAWMYSQAAPDHDADGTLRGYVGTITDVTERKVAEAALAQSEAQFRAITENSSDVTIIFDGERRVTYASPSTARLLGYDRDGFIGEQSTTFIHPDGRRHFDRILDKAAAKPEQTHHISDIKVVSIEGNVHHFEILVTGLVDTVGFRGVVANARDITERVGIERRLRERENHLETLARLSPGGMFRANPHGNIDHVNRRWSEIFNMSPEDARQQGWAKAILSDDREAALAGWRRAVAMREPYSGEFRINGENGEIVWIFSQAVPELDDHGQCIGYVGIAIDNTERRRAEHNVALARHRADEAQKYLTDAIESFSDGFALFDEDDRLVMCNSAYSKGTKDIAEFLKPGTPFEDLVRAMYGSKILIADEYRTEEIIQKRLEYHRNPEKGAYTTQTGDGGWLLISEYRTHDGGTALIRSDITGRMTAENALAKRESELQTLTDLSPVGIYRSDRLGNLVYVSDRWAKIMGLKGDAALNEGWINSVHPDDRQKAIDAWRAYIDGDEEDYRIECRIVRPDEPTIWTISQVTREYGDDGEFLGFVGSLTDVSDLKNAQSALEQSEERFSHAMRGANDGLWDWDLETGSFYYSPRWAEMLGYESTELPDGGEAWETLLHPDDRPRVDEFHKACLEGEEKGYEVEVRFRHKDGHYVDILSRVIIIHGDEHAPVRMVGTNSDISNRVAAERALAKSEAELRTVTKLSPVGIYRSKRDGAPEYINQKGLDILDAETVEELSSGKWLQHLHPDDREAMSAAWLAAYDEGKPFEYEYRFRDHEGSETWVLSQATPEFDENGIILHSIGSLTDVTEQKNAEKALISAREIAETANNAKSDFLSSMSHELRTPMNAILGFGQLLDQDSVDPLSDAHHEFVGEILKAGYLMVDLINDVLDLEKIESGKMPLNITEAPLEPLLESCVNMIRASARAEDIQLITEFTIADLTPIRVDETRFRQILLNLLSNAVKYNTPAGRVTLTCETMGDGMVRINVTDTGNGIPPDQAKQVFEPFERLGAENSSTPGTGIGLTIARQLTESMGGVLDFESTVGEGSTFWIDLPSATHKLH